MLSSLWVVGLAASWVPMASAAQFWWSYQSENSTDSYDPVFEICANKNATSCSACNSEDDDVGAKQCYSDLYNNICYEPKREETCCKDKYGTSCYHDFYCAFTEDNVAFCCAEGESVEDCGETFNQTLTKDGRDEHPTTTITNAFAPSLTATDQSQVARPERTKPPNMVPGSTKAYSTKDPDSEEKFSAAVKIGIAIGVFIGVAILAALVVMGFLHWRRKTKYNALGHGQPDDTLLAKHPEPFSAHSTPRPISAAPGPFEPMRSEYPHDDRHSRTASPLPPPHSDPNILNPFVDRSSYSDHPAQPSHHGIELTHMPPPGHH